MKTAKIGKITLESGKVKIAAPVIGKCEEDVLSDAVLLRKENPDIVEWRADFYWEEDGLKDFSLIMSTAKKLRIFLEDIPLIFTIRSAEEGGNAKVTLEVYESIIREISKKSFADAIDIEIFKFSGQEERLERLVDDVRKSGLTIIMSNHDFEKTPSIEEMMKRLQMMEAAGADLAKLAVMPRERQDVMDLMNATFLADQTLEIPLITMSMGELGKPSRVSGSVTGSCLTFSAKGKSLSAPGQISIEKIRGVL